MIILIESQYTLIKKNSIVGRFEHELNLYSLNGTIEWERNQHISLDLFGNYSIDDDTLDCTYRSSLSSTLKNIPSLSASLDHLQNDTKIDTILRLQVSCFWFELREYLLIELYFTVYARRCHRCQEQMGGCS